MAFLEKYDCWNVEWCNTAKDFLQKEIDKNTVAQDPVNETTKATEKSTTSEEETSQKKESETKEEESADADSDKKEAETLMEETKKAMESDDVEKITKAKDKLLEKANGFASRVYEDLAKASQEASANTTTEEPKEDNNDDTVVDAEYEEK